MIKTAYPRSDREVILPQTFVGLRDLIFGDVAVLIKSFFDGSGKGSDQSGYVALVCHSASKTDWDRFEEAWKDALKQKGVKGRFHAAEVVNGKGEFESWCLPKRASLIDHMLGVLQSADYIRGVVYAVSIDAHNHPKKLRPIPTIGDICARGTLQSVGLEYPKDDLSLVFDRTEEFRKHVQKLWDQNKNTTGALARIVDIDAADSNKVCALQGTDLSAWYVRNEWMIARGQWLWPTDKMIQLQHAVQYTFSKRFEFEGLMDFDFSILDIVL